MNSKERREARYKRRIAARAARKTELNREYGDFDKVIRKPNKRSIVTMRRKLKKFYDWVASGKFTYHDARTSYQSWRGHIRRCNAHRTLQAMDALFKSLFLLDWQHAAGGNIYL